MNQSAIHRSTLFSRLATLERAGIPLQAALDTLARGEAQGIAQPLDKLQQALERGESLSDAGRRVGLWRPWEQMILAAGQSTGRLAESFEALATHHGHQARRWQRLRGRLLLPALVLLVGVVVGPLPALVGGQIGLLGYLVRVILPLLVLGVVVQVLRRAYQGLPGSSALADWFAGLPLVRQLRQRDRIAVLALLMDSGMPADMAFASMADSAPAAGHRIRLQRAARAVERGAGFTATLAQVGLLDDPAGVRLLQSGEEAGRLPEMLGRYRERLDEALDGVLDGVTGVLPWVVYGGVVGWVFL